MEESRGAGQDGVIFLSSSEVLVALSHAHSASTDLAQNASVPIGDLAHVLALRPLEGSDVLNMAQVIGLCVTPVVAQTHPVIALQQWRITEVL